MAPVHTVAFQPWGGGRGGVAFHFQENPAVTPHDPSPICFPAPPKRASLSRLWLLRPKWQHSTEWQKRVGHFQSVLTNLPGSGRLRKKTSKLKLPREGGSNTPEIIKCPRRLRETHSRADIVSFERKEATRREKAALEGGRAGMVPHRVSELSGPHKKMQCKTKKTHLRFLTRTDSLRSDIFVGVLL